MTLTAHDLVAKAKQSLDDALASGGDTQAARTRLKAAQAELQALDASQAPAVDIDAEARLQAEALAMTETARSAILAKLSTFQPLAPLPPVLPLGMGLAVIQARRADAEAEAAIREYETKGEQLASRLAAIRGKREAVAARRLAGHGDDEADGLVLRVLDLDEAGLVALIARHQAERPLDPSATIDALRVWREGIALVELRALHDQAQALQVALVACASQLASMAGPRTIFRLRPDPVLSTAARIGLF